MNQSIIPDLSLVLTAVETAELLSKTCTIQQALGAPDDLGQPDLTTWTNVSGLTSIPCMMAPGDKRLPTAFAERDTQTMTLERADFTVLLDGYYSNILLRYRAVIDGVGYDIKDVVNDSQSITTWLYLRYAVL